MVNLIKLIKGMIIFIFLISLTPYSFAQIEESSKIVTAIEIRGNKTIGTAKIISKIKTRVGQEYSQNIISSDLKRIYNMGFFSDVKVDRVDFKGGFKVIFYLTEKPIIEELVMEGNRVIRKRKLQEIIQSKVGDFLDYHQLKEDIKNIQDEYKKRGFSLADINYDVVVNEQTNKANVKIIIQESSRIRIKKIDFVGNSSFRDRALARIIKTRPRIWFFSSGFYNKEVVTEDIERLKAFYKREGFLDVKVDYKTEIKKRGLMYLTFFIEEGIKYLIGNITIQGNNVITDEEITSRLQDTLPGKVFSYDLLQLDVDRIKEIYFERGYIFADVQYTTSIDPQTGNVDIEYNIDEGELAFVDRINIVGNTKTKDVVIRRELRINPGERFDGYKLRRSRERLRNLGFFEDVGFDIEPGTAPNRKNLVVEVKEAKTGEFSFGGGYSSIDEFVGFISIEQRNFDFKNFPYFTGDGQDLVLYAEWGTVRENLQLSFTEPWIFDYPLSFGFDAFKSSHERETDVGYGFDEKKTGGDIRLAKDLSEYVSAGFTYRYENIEISDISPEASSELKKEEGKTSLSSVSFRLTRDTRDNRFEPTKGTYLSGWFDVAGGVFGGDKDFVRLTGKLSHDIPLFKKSVLEFRLQLGLMDAFGDSTDVPIYERYFAGGADTIRGYNERKVGPIDSISEDPIGGESMFVANIEYTKPLFEYVKAAVFYDVGNVWSKFSDFGSGGFKAGVGAGVRIKTPIGPIRLDYGYPLNREPGEEKKEGQFYFSMSHGF
jgi:outer membrane protein insertion porin family